MVKFLESLLAAVLIGKAVVSGEATKAECGRDIGKCPENKPCCSQYGQCGIGAFCLGGCDSKFSFALKSCVPGPVCKNKVTTFESGIGSVASIYEYLGDASKADWVAEGKPVAWNGNLLLTMPPDSVGTVLSSTHYVWYGRVSATMKTSRGAGVVSAFILFSGVKDEIDFEWVGVNLHNVQTNYYFQGIPVYTNGGNHTVEGGSTYDEYHTYDIDWTPDSITWHVDGKVIRKKYKKDTWNEKTKNYDYPQTPSRVQLSLWPGGLPTNAKGTIEWAGGVIDWNHPDVKEAGYYYATVKQLKIECYDPPAGAKKQGSKSYIYGDESGLESSVIISDEPYILKSFLGSGTDMDKEPKKATATSKGASEPTDIVETIPGNNGGGTSTHDIINNGGTDNSTGNTDTGFKDNTPPQESGFNQDSTGDASRVKGSMMAVAVAIAGLIV